MDSKLRWWITTGVDLTLAVKAESHAEAEYKFYDWCWCIIYPTDTRCESYHVDADRAAHMIFGKSIPAMDTEFMIKESKRIEDQKKLDMEFTRCYRLESHPPVFGVILAPRETADWLNYVNPAKGSIGPYDDAKLKVDGGYFYINAAGHMIHLPVAFTPGITVIEESQGD
jgi:hypothetical protein